MCVCTHVCRAKMRDQKNHSVIRMERDKNKIRTVLKQRQKLKHYTSHNNNLTSPVPANMINCYFFTNYTFSLLCSSCLIDKIIEISDHKIVPSFCHHPIQTKTTLPLNPFLKFSEQAQIQ